MIDIQSYDTAFVKGKQLSAMLTAIIGEGFEHFITMDEDTQHSYLLALSEHARELNQALTQKV